MDLQNAEKRKRASGVLMHISSLYGDYSIGSFGEEALEFVDFLAERGFTYWQVLPFCMADECDSPYKSFSAFAGNPYFVDLPTLCKEGLLTEEELAGARQQTPWLCEFPRLRKERLPLLRTAAKRAFENSKTVFKIDEFMSAHRDLRDACEFLALKQANGGKPWSEWTEDKYDGQEFDFWRFVQYEFFTQWSEVRKYAGEKGVKIIGDIPFYVDFDSCDVWANRKMFLLSQDGRPTGVAGVPPDYFAEDGQMWNNPLYDWSEMKKDGFCWWKRRLLAMFELFDGVRIDHFRAFESYWCIPSGAISAKSGHWEKGPGKDFIDMMNSIKGDSFIIAEDLGDITQDVVELVKYSGFPGMKVFQFAFNGDRDSPHLPHNYPANCAAYTGTHDNNTLYGFICEADSDTRKKIFDYCSIQSGSLRQACSGIIKEMLASHADTVIFPVQDILRYGADTRMNRPGIGEGNWAYRVKKEQLAESDAETLFHWNTMYARI